MLREIIGKIRERTDVLIQTTNGIGVRRDPVTGEAVWPTDEERLALIELDPTPDLFGVAAGSTDFLFPEGGYHEEGPYINSPHFLKETIRAVYAKGSTLEYEIVDTHALHRLSHYADEGVFDRDAPFVWLLYGEASASFPLSPGISPMCSSRARSYSRERGLGRSRWRPRQFHLHDARHFDGLHDCEDRVRGRALPSEWRCGRAEPSSGREARRDRRDLRPPPRDAGRGTGDHGPEPHQEADSGLTCKSSATSPSRPGTALLIVADVFMPDGDEPTPVIAAISPYGKDIHWSERFPLDELADQGDHMVWETPNPEWWTERGYAVVRADTRGTGKSEGRLDPLSPKKTPTISTTSSSGAARSPGRQGRSPRAVSPGTR